MNSRRSAYRARAQAAATRWGLGDLHGRTTTRPRMVPVDEIVFARRITDQITNSGARTMSDDQPVLLYPSDRLGGLLVLGDGFHRVAHALEAGSRSVLAVVEPLGQDEYEGDDEDDDRCARCGCPDFYFGCLPPGECARS